MFKNELLSTFGTELDVTAKPFERFDYHTAYRVAGFAVLPYVVPVNPAWKQIAGDLMYQWVFMVHGQ